MKLNLNHLNSHSVTFDLKEDTPFLVQKIN